MTNSESAPILIRMDCWKCEKMIKDLSREYIRHPAKVPLEIVPHSPSEQLNLQLNNISLGGLSFDSPVEFHINTLVKIKISSIKPVFIVDAVVQWCHQLQDHFEMGVRFLDNEDAYKVRMVEQACHIAEYRKEVQQTTGRRMTWNKASKEWIDQYAGNFPEWPSAR